MSRGMACFGNRRGFEMKTHHLELDKYVSLPFCSFKPGLFQRFFQYTVQYIRLP